MDAVFPYTKSVQLFHCPDDSGQNGGSGQYIPYQQLTAPDDKHYGSYGMNSAYYNNAPINGGSAPSLAGPGKGGISQAALNSPASTIWVTDGCDSYQVDWPSGNPAVTLSNGYSQLGSPGGLGDGAAVARHSGPDLVNTLFCDGHVKSQNMGQLIKTAPESDTLTYYYQFICNGQ